MSETPITSAVSGVADLCSKVRATGTGLSKVEMIKAIAEDTFPDTTKFISQIQEAFEGNLLTPKKVAECLASQKPSLVKDKNEVKKEDKKDK